MLRKEVEESQAECHEANHRHFSHFCNDHYLTEYVVLHFTESGIKIQMKSKMEK